MATTIRGALKLAASMALLAALALAKLEASDFPIGPADALKALQADWGSSLRAGFRGSYNIEALDRLILHPSDIDTRELLGNEAFTYAREVIEGAGPYWSQRIVIYGTADALKAGGPYLLVTTTAEDNDGWLLAFVDASSGLVTVIINIPEG